MEAELQSDQIEPVEVAAPENETEEHALSLGNLISALEDAREVAGSDAKVHLGTKKLSSGWEPTGVFVMGHETHHCNRCQVDHFSPYIIQVVMK